MGNGNWWRRSLNRHFRLLDGRFRALEQRLRIKEKRAKARKKRTLEQQEIAFERLREEKERNEAITGMDALERKKIAKELMWRAKWDKKGRVLTYGQENRGNHSKNQRPVIHLKG